MNPRAAINDLLPFQGSPFGQLGYFSKLPYLLSSSDIHLCRSQRQVILYLVYFILSSTFLTFLKSFYFVLNKRREWDSNPRALADKRFSRPPRYDHFDISPYIVVCLWCFLTADASDILAPKYSPVNNFFTFFSFFLSQTLTNPEIPHKSAVFSIAIPENNTTKTVRQDKFSYFKAKERGVAVATAIDDNAADEKSDKSI